MRVSLNWLNELVDLSSDLSPQEIAEHLTMGGLEVESVISLSEDLKDVVVARVIACEAIPNRPQAQLCNVDIGSKVVSIVTTAKNIVNGDFVVVALPGASLFGNVTVEARKVFDIESFGMFCSERELGISDDQSQVLVLSPEEFKELAPGQDAIQTLGLDDTILEIAITPNRADALSHIGVAREIAAVLQSRSKLQNPTCREFSGPVHDALLIHIEAREACPRYAARVVENIQVGKSPLWLRQRLFACGVRPINNVVDITNLVLLERGHPLHAFDIQKLAKDRGRVNLNVRFAEANEKIKTLDGVERFLNSEDLVIADTKGPVALAGIMGGENTEVDDMTSGIVLESAYFHPSVVRKTARRQQLSTEASYRFERGADPNGVMPALDRAADLMVQLASGKVRREAIDVYPKKIESLEILVRPKRLQEISGLPPEELDESKIRSRFALLGIETVGRRGESLCFRAPTFRPDLTREIDLVEEAMRLVGYGKIPITAIFGRKTPVALSNDRYGRVLSKISASLKTSGYSSALNFSFGSPSKYELFEENSDNIIRLQNPLGEELSAMRRWLLPGLLDNVALNLRRGAKDIRLFEMGTVFLGASENGKEPHIETLVEHASFDAWAKEKTHVAGVCTGIHETTGLNEKERPFDFFDVKGAVENMLLQLRVDIQWRADQLRFESAKSELCFLHPGFSAKILLKGQQVGYVGRVHPDVQEAYDLKQPVYCFELDTRKLADLSSDRIEMKVLPKFPSIARDVAILIPSEVSAAELAQTVRDYEPATELLENFKVFDVYVGKGIPQGRKSVALAFVFRSLERTLKDDEVQIMMDELVKRFTSSFGAQLR